MADPSRPARRRGRRSPSDGAARVPVARLAASQLKRLRRIVDAAVGLAEKGGFEAVRLRDVAEASDVALGTLYKYFRSKEDILVFALREEVERFEAATAARPPEGRTPLDRLTQFFERATDGMTRRPHFARAVIRSIAAGDHEIATQVAAFHLRMTRLIVGCLRGAPIDLAAPIAEATGSERESQMAFVMQNVWFASLAGWAGGLHPAKTVAEQVRVAASLMLNQP